MTWGRVNGDEISFSFLKTNRKGVSNPPCMTKNGDHWAKNLSNLILSCPNILKFASVEALNSISQRTNRLKASLQFQCRSKVSTGLAFSYSEKAKEKKRKEKKTSTPVTHHSSSITLISGRGILTSKGFRSLFLASVSPLPMCEGQVSILDHVL